LLSAADGGTFVEPSKVTLIKWLREWLKAAIKPQCRPATYTRYHGIIENISARRLSRTCCSRTSDRRTS
jgi:hypothetical protein